MQSTGMCIASFAACALMGASVASGDITQVFDPGDLTGGPFTVEDFEDDIFEAGATYSASSGILRVTAENFTDNGTPSGLWGLSTVLFPDPITITFDVAATSVGMWFGNDDLCCADGFFANLDIFGTSGLLGTISVDANMNDFADQFIGFNSDNAVTSVTIRYGNGGDVGLFTYIDDVYFNIPSPCTWDFDGDNVVGTGDLILLLGSWGDPYGTADLIELLGNWGPCPK